MLNISELETRWLKYKIKSYIPYGIIIVSVIIIVSITIYLFNNYTPKQIPTDSKKTEQISVLKVPLKPIKKPTEKKIIVLNKPKPIEPKEANKAKQIKLAPSLTFMKDMQSSSLPYDNGDKIVPDKQIEQKALTQEPISKPKPKIQLQPKKILAVQNEDKPSRITIKRQDAMQDIQSVISRFKKNNNPGLSLFIAKKYYELEDYEKAYNYALVTNKINSDIEDSWLVFSKSLFKLGKKDKAISTLKKYIKSSYSNNAKLLLEDMNSGKFQ